MAGKTKYSQEVRERAVRMVFEHEVRHGSRWETIRSVSGKLGCSAETLRNWVKRAEVDSGRRDGVTSDDRSKIKVFEREISELRPLALAHSPVSAQSTDVRSSPK